MSCRCSSCPKQRTREHPNLWRIDENAACFAGSGRLELVSEKADHLVALPNAYGGEEVGAGLRNHLDSPLGQAVPVVQNGDTYLLTADNAVEGYWTPSHLLEALLAK